MNMGVDEAGRNSAVAQIKELRTSWAADRARHFGYGAVLDQNLRRTEHRVAQAIEQFSADDDCF